jgi:hypothetical protein
MTKILIIGEAYGVREMLFDHPFVGSSGAELARMLAQAEIAPSIGIDYPTESEMMTYWKGLELGGLITVTNVFNERPPDNNIKEFFTSAKEGVNHLPPLLRGKYLKPSHLHHVEKLWDKINALKPHLIIALGNTASWAVLGQGAIGVIRGTVKMAPNFQIKVLPTYHPAAVMRQWNLRPIVIMDLIKARDEAETKHIERIKRWITIEPTLADIVEWAQRPAEYYACDIETYGKQVSMVGFARSDYDALVIPFLDETKPRWSYWPSIEDECTAWRLVVQIMRTKVPKIFQNGVFDITRLASVGVRPFNCAGDSMLLHHALYPEMLKGLGFLGSVYSREIAWKQMRTAGNNLKRDE